MTKKLLILLLIFAIAVNINTTAANAASVITVKLGGTEYYSGAFQVLKLVNQERKKNGLPNLKMDEELLDVAMKRAAETNVYFSHTRPDGSNCFDIFPDNLQAMGENIAAGQSTPDKVMNSWMNSDGHRENILNDGFNSIGIGCYKTGSCFYWVQIFGNKDSIYKAEKTNYKDVKHTRAITSDPANVNINMSVPDKTIARNTTARLRMEFKNEGMPYDTVKLYNSQFTFKSSDEKVASVDDKGVITGLKKGTAKIKAIFKKDGKKTGCSVKITVN